VGFLFDLHQSNVYRDIRYLEPLVRSSVPIPKKVHKLTRRLRTMEEVEEFFPGFKAFIDATEQEIPRPKNALKRKTHYSGKKRRHTVKTQLTVNSKGLIVHKTNHARGRRHDYDIFKRNHPSLPEKVRVVVEHTIPRVKKFNIFGQEFRNRLRHYDLMTDIVSGLINFRIMGTKGLLL